jgi:hypothetical protein
MMLLTHLESGLKLLPLQIKEEYVRSRDHLESAKKAGYKDTHTLRNQACKLRRE